ncbi:MAG: hypothetical protein KC549_13240 [Myxococcales bacterium]|nr:hypothetical protein [Myxococcales bacterium]
MSRYIVINLADRGGFGAISSLFAGVTARRTRGAFASLFLAQHEVELIDAFDLLDDDLIGQLHYGDHRVQAVRNRILGAKKIYLATHGIATDVDNCFASAAGGLALCNYRQLASFMMALMPTRDTTYDLALVMCYGARTQTYRTTQLDQQGMVPVQELRTSFAYKFFREISRHRKIRMTARTGAVGFDSTTGRSTVEQEIAVEASIDKEVLLRQPNVIPATQAYRQAEIQAANGGNDTYDAFRQLSQAFKADPNRVAGNAEEQVIQDYQDIIRQKEQYIAIMDANMPQAKYGKIVYTRTGGTLRIVNKYAHNGGELLLYQGLMT